MGANDRLMAFLNSGVCMMEHHDMCGHSRHLERCVRDVLVWPLTFKNLLGSAVLTIGANHPRGSGSRPVGLGRTGSGLGFAAAALRRTSSGSSAASDESGPPR